MSELELMDPPATGVPHHAKAASSTPRQQAWKWFTRFKWHLLLLFLSDLGRDIIERKYDAFTTDRAYVNKSSGKGLIGKFIDWLVLRQETHVALRERLDIVSNELFETLLRSRIEGHHPVRLASGPCGLVRDLCRTWRRLDEVGERPHEWLEMSGLDLDLSGDVLPEAGRRALARGVPIRLVQQDLLDSESLCRLFADQEPTVFLSMGLTVWLDDEGRNRFFRDLYEILVPGGTLIIDNFRRHDGSRFLDDLEMVAWYPDDQTFEEGLTAAGFHIKARHEAGSRVNVVYRAYKPTCWA
jgi:SAM-dependent methyltransferase